jgi:hypothetical protein
VVEGVCRVCGYDDGDERWTGPGGAEYVICQCCAAESGVEDSDLRSVREYRPKWHATSCRWFAADERPQGWEPAAQVLQIPVDWR